MPEPSAPAPALDARAVTHAYGGRLALRGLSLRVEPGELFGVLGPNGGGKTTLFRIATALMPASEGHVAVFGHDTARAARHVRPLIGVVFQEPALDRELTVRENLRVHGALVGLGGWALDDRIDALLMALDLAGRADARVKTLSGGLARRTDLARGLLHRPRLLFLDEPTSGLDPLARRDLWEVVARLRREEGTTVIVATHLMEEAERCDRLALLHEGVLVAEGTPAALKAGLGAGALWLESAEPEALARALSDRLGWPTRLVGRTVLVEAEDAPAALPAAYAAVPALITAATIRAPTLEDVFAAATQRPPVERHAHPSLAR